MMAGTVNQLMKQSTKVSRIIWKRLLFWQVYIVFHRVIQRLVFLMPQHRAFRHTSYNAFTGCNGVCFAYYFRGQIAEDPRALYNVVHEIVPELRAFVFNAIFVLVIPVHHKMWFF